MGAQPQARQEGRASGTGPPPLRRPTAAPGPQAPHAGASSTQKRIPPPPPPLSNKRCSRTCTTGTAIRVPGLWSLRWPVIQARRPVSCLRSGRTCAGGQFEGKGWLARGLVTSELHGCPPAAGAAGAPVQGTGGVLCARQQASARQRTAGQPVSQERGQRRHQQPALAACVLQAVPAEGCRRSAISTARTEGRKQWRAQSSPSLTLRMRQRLQAQRRSQASARNRR